MRTHLTPKQLIELHATKGTTGGARHCGVPRSTFWNAVCRAKQQGTTARVMPVTTKTCNILAVGDPHCPVMLQSYPDFLADVQRQFKTNRVVIMGDTANWNALSFHLGPKPQSCHEEYKATKAQLHTLRKMFRHADVLVGNHCALPARRLEEVGMDADIFLKDHGTLWEIKGWTWHRRYSFVKIDGVLYTHGEVGSRTGPQGAIGNAKERFSSLVQGHLHGEAGVWWFANTEARIFAMQTGCGVDRHRAEMDYGMKFNKKPIVACGVILGGQEAYTVTMPMERYS